MGDVQVTLLTNVRDFFEELLKDALERRKLKTFPLAQTYILNLLEHYMKTPDLFHMETSEISKPPQTLAELMLTANQHEGTPRIELLKKLGDVSLYVSGFFGDSLQRKLVDMDYYVQMGGAAYSTLAGEAKEDTTRRVFAEFAEKFVDYMDVLTVISQKTMIQNDQSLLRLYDQYIRTGSSLAKEHLIEKGVIPKSDLAKNFKQ